MNNSLKILLILFIPFYLKGQNIAYTVDIRQSIYDKKYYIGIAARDNTPTGHSFVIFGQENDQKKVSEVFLQSFYPLKDGAPFSKGQVISEFKSKNYIPNYDHIIFIVPQSDYQRAKERANQIAEQPKRYNLFTNNCINYSQEVIGRTGIKLPSTLLKLPSEYLKEIDNALQNNGLDYKENGLIKQKSLSTEVYENRNDINNGKFRLVNDYEIMIGKKLSGEIDGITFIESKKYGKALLIYNNGLVNYSHTKFLDNKFEKAQKELKVFKSKVPSVVIKYPNGSQRKINYDTVTGRKLTGELKIDGYNCEETYYSEDSLFSKCTHPNGDYSESDYKIIIEDNFIKYVPSSNRQQYKIKGVSFAGSVHYKDHNIYQKGFVTYDNGDTYEGDLRNGVPHGWGTFTHKEDRTTFLGIYIGTKESYSKTFSDWIDGVAQFGRGPTKPAFTNPFDNRVFGSGEIPSQTAIEPTQPPVATSNEKKEYSKKKAETQIKYKNSYWDPTKKRWILL